MSAVTRTINPPNVPNQMGQQWFLMVKQSIEEAIQAGACKKMDYDYNALPFVLTKAASPNATGQYEKTRFDEEGVLLPFSRPQKLNIAG